MNNIVNVKNVIIKIFVPDCIRSTVPFSSVDWHGGLAARGQLLNEHSNIWMHKYADAAQLLDEGRKSRKKLQNTIKLIKVSYLNWHHNSHELSPLNNNNNNNNLLLIRVLSTHLLLIGEIQVYIWGYRSSGFSGWVSFRRFGTNHLIGL
jgi:hypothetical protein